MFGTRIVALRKEKGLTQSQLAQELGISRSSLSLYEIEKREPDTETLFKISKHFGVSTDYLLGHSNTRIQEEDLEWRYPHMKNRVGTIMARYRKDNKLSSKEFADKMGISTKLEHCLEAGLSNPSLNLLKKMSRVMNLDLNYLIGAKKSSGLNYDLETGVAQQYNFDMDGFFFARFEELCLSNGISSDNCLEKLDIEQNDFQDIQFNRIPTLQELLKISYSLNVSLDYLVGKTDLPFFKLTDEELSLLLNYRDCAPQYQRNILDRTEKLSIASINSSVAADDGYLDEGKKSSPSSGTEGETKVV